MKIITISSCFRAVKTVTMNNIFYLLCLFAFLFGQNAISQTVLINPSAEGGFENGSTFEANGWTPVGDVTNTWTVGSAPGWFTGSAGAYVSNDTGTSWAYTNNAISRASFYRDVAFPAGSESITLNFDWRANGNDGNWDNLLVYVMDTSIVPSNVGPTTTNTTTTGWPGYTNGTTGYFLLQRNGTSVPTETTNVNYTFSAAQIAYVAGSTKRLVFVWKNDGSGGANPPAAVDNISLSALVPTCTVPLNLSTNSLTFNSVNLEWNEPVSGSIGFEYELRTSGAPESGATGLVSNGNLADGVLTTDFQTLTENTNYTFYLRSNCGGEFSSWISVSFLTGYCVPSSTSALSYINNFSTTGGSTNISNLGSGYTTGGYQDNYDTATVSQYETGIVNFSTAIVGGTVGTSIWVDWNNDLVFDNATERVFVTTAFGGNQSGSFEIPAGTQLGDYRMRVRIDFNAIAPDACASTNTRTEAEDYKLTVIETPSCLPPSNVTAEANSPFTATINWAASITEPSEGYQYYYSTENTAPLAGTTPSGEVGAGILNAEIDELESSTTYFVWVRSNCGSDTFSDWTSDSVSFKTECNPPVITETTPGSVCGQGTVDLSATASAGTIKWYNAETGGELLATGGTFTTPTITETTSFWVESATGSTESAGKPAPPASATGTSIANWGIVFNATDDVDLQSVSVYSTAAGTLNIKVTDSNLVELYSTGNINITAGGTTTPNVVPLNFTVPAGTGYRILVKAFSGVNLIRDSTTLSFPYVGSDGVVSITSSEWGGTTTGTYYYFYDVKYSTGCASERTEVIATVTTAPDFSLSSDNLAICPGETSEALIIEIGDEDYDTYVWSPSANVTGDGQNGWVFNPSETTIYTLTASQSAGALCETTTELTVTVNPEPVITVSDDTSICAGESSTLSATLLETVVLGTDTTLTSATTQPTAFCNRWDQYWNQTIYTAAELQAAGFSAGSINAITYEITTIGSGTNVTNFSIRIGTTTETTVSSFATSGFTTVYGPATYEHAIGLNTITFDTPYVWDGVSNIIIDVRQDGADSTNNAITYYTATAQPMTISAITSTDSAVTTLQDLVAAASVTPATSLQRLNVIFDVTGDASAIEWLWTPGNLTTSSIDVTPTQTTTYTVRATNTTTGCFTEEIVEVTVNTVAAPTGNAFQTLSEGQTLADLVVNGENLIWYSDDNLQEQIPSTTVAEDNTTYFVTQTVGECTSEALAITVEVTLSTGDFNLVSLKAYPNPTSDFVTVSYNNDITNVAVINMLGQTLMTKDVNVNTTQIDMTSLPTGNYFVKVTVEGAVKTIKIVKN